MNLQWHLFNLSLWFYRCNPFTWCQLSIYMWCKWPCMNASKLPFISKAFAENSLWNYSLENEELTPGMEDHESYDVQTGAASHAWATVWPKEGNSLIFIESTGYSKDVTGDAGWFDYRICFSVFNRTSAASKIYSCLRHSGVDQQNVNGLQDAFAKCVLNNPFQGLTSTHLCNKYYEENVGLVVSFNAVLVIMPLRSIFYRIQLNVSSVEVWFDVAKVQEYAGLSTDYTRNVGDIACVIVKLIQVKIVY